MYSLLPFGTPTGSLKLVSKNKLILFLLILEHYFEKEGEHRGNATMENGAAIPLAAKGMVHATREHQSKFGLEILLEI
jgi:hypothetical protein